MSGISRELSRVLTIAVVSLFVLITLTVRFAHWMVSANVGQGTVRALQLGLQTVLRVVWDVTGYGPTKRTTA